MSLKVFFGIVVVAALGVALWLANQYGYLDIQQLRQIAPGTRTTEPTSTRDESMVQADAIHDLTVVAITASSITVTDIENKTSTFTLLKNIPVYSVVPVGEVGRGLDDIQPGTKIKLFKSRANPTEAMAIAFARDSALSLTQEEMTNSATGDVAAVDSASVTIALPNGGVPVIIMIASTTKTLATVKGGQAGYPMAVGHHVVASGITAKDGKATAKLIVYYPY